MRCPALRAGVGDRGAGRTSFMPTKAMTMHAAVRISGDGVSVKTRLFIYGALEQMGLGDLPSLKGLHG